MPNSLSDMNGLPSKNMFHSKVFNPLFWITIENIAGGLNLLRGRDPWTIAENVGGQDALPSGLCFVLKSFNFSLTISNLSVTSEEDLSMAEGKSKQCGIPNGSVIPCRYCVVSTIQPRLSNQTRGSI